VCNLYTGINVLCGVGILSTPYAIKQGGWIGLGILSLFALLAWYTGMLLRHCLDSKEGLETYPDIGHAAFGSTGRIVISVKSSLEYDNAFYGALIFCTFKCDVQWRNDSVLTYLIFFPCLWLNCCR